MGVRCGGGSRKIRPLHIECVHKRPNHINEKRRLNSVALVIATNKKQGEAADGTDA